MPRARRAHAKDYQQRPLACDGLSEMVDMLKDRGNIDELTADHCASARNPEPYLAELTKTYEENL